MNDTAKIRLPDAVLEATFEGTSVVRAYREFLGYSVEDLAVACGLSIEEIENIEAGHRYDKGYRERIARSLSLPENTFSSEVARATAGNRSVSCDGGAYGTRRCAL